MQGRVHKQARPLHNEAALLLLKKKVDAYRLKLVLLYCET